MIYPNTSIVLWAICPLWLCLWFDMTSSVLPHQAHVLVSSPSHFLHLRRMQMDWRFTRKQREREKKRQNKWNVGIKWVTDGPRENEVYAKLAAASEFITFFILEIMKGVLSHLFLVTVFSFSLLSSSHSPARRCSSLPWVMITVIQIRREGVSPHKWWSRWRVQIGGAVCVCLAR